jgi:Mrp family chromosome partitioning ATPase
MSTDIQIKSEPSSKSPSPQTNGDAAAAARHHFASPPTVCARPGSEYFDALLWRLFERREDPTGAGYLLGVTGCARQSGVSTVAANVAIRAADHGLGPVLLIDANEHHPHLHRLFSAKSRVGLAEVMSGQTSLAEAAQSTRVHGLQLVPLGSAGLMKRVRIDSARIEALVAELRETYSLVLVDLPGACQMSHCPGLAHALDGALLVIRSERIGRGVANECQRRLAHDGIHILGAVITDQHTYLPSWLT